MCTDNQYETIMIFQLIFSPIFQLKEKANILHGQVFVMRGSAFGSRDGLRKT